MTLCLDRFHWWDLKLNLCSVDLKFRGLFELCILYFERVAESILYILSGTSNLRLLNIMWEMIMPAFASFWSLIKLWKVRQYTSVTNSSTSATLSALMPGLQLNRFSPRGFVTSACFVDSFGQNNFSSRLQSTSYILMILSLLVWVMFGVFFYHCNGRRQPSVKRGSCLNNYINVGVNGLYHLLIKGVLFGIILLSIGYYNRFIMS